MREKHYVYSARTTEQGLVLLRARGERGWDAFINEAVAGHHGLNLTVIRPMSSAFLQEQKAKREARESEKAAGKGERETKARAKVDTKRLFVINKCNEFFHKAIIVTSF